MTLNGFGLVTQSNAPFFVPFNTSVAPFGPDSPTAATQQPFGVTDQQRDDAYSQWLQAGLQAGLQGMLQYQVCLDHHILSNITSDAPQTSSRKVT